MFIFQKGESIKSSAVETYNPNSCHQTLQVDIFYPCHPVEFVRNFLSHTVTWQMSKVK